MILDYILCESRVTRAEKQITEKSVKSKTKYNFRLLHLMTIFSVLYAQINIGDLRTETELPYVTIRKISFRCCSLQVQRYSVWVWLVSSAWNGKCHNIFQHGSNAIIAYPAIQIKKTISVIYFGFCNTNKMRKTFSHAEKDNWKENG